MSDETTLLLLKPDCISKKLSGEVIRRLEAHGFRVRGCKMIQLTDEVLKEHYAHIASKPFFPEVAGFMKSRPVIALALAGDGVISKVRDLLGPTDSKAAAKGTIRGDFAISVQNNLVHGSDSAENAKLEIELWFKPDELVNYTATDANWVS